MPLTGIRVVDLTRILSGPFCTAQLGDLGAEVIKIEPPGKGDPVRGQGEIREGFSWYFANFNRNKRSLTLDLYKEEGREVLRRLIAGADVVVENFRPGVMAKMGFDYEGLKAIKPDIVYCNINGFGADGPYRDRPAFDFIAQAMSGFMSLNGGEADPPLRAGPPISDLIAGLYAALAIVAALQRRRVSGTGEAISVSLLGALVSMLGFQATEFLCSGQLPRRTGNDHALVAPYGLFRTADGEVAIAPSNDSFYFRLLDALELGELREHPDFRSNALRMANRPAINAAIEAKTRLQPSAHWIEVLNKAGVPCGQVLNLAEVFADPQVLQQRLAVTLEHPGHGPVTMLGSPMAFSGSRSGPQRPAPDLGADSDALLGELGYDAAAIAAIRAAGAI